MASKDESNGAVCAPDQGALDAVGEVSSDPQPGSSSTFSKLRMPVLMAILLSLLFAAWYDYRVARPAVDEAFDVVTQLHRQYSQSADMPVMTNMHVQQAVGAAPAYTITKHSYDIEVYAWTAGLPFRSHDLYVVYYGNGDMRFARHYKFVLPVADLDPEKAGPKLASAKPRGPGPSPYEAVGHEDSAPEADSEGADQGTEGGQTADTDP